MSEEEGFHRHISRVRDRGDIAIATSAKRENENEGAVILISALKSRLIRDENTVLMVTIMFSSSGNAQQPASVT